MPVPPNDCTTSVGTFSAKRTCISIANTSNSRASWETHQLGWEKRCAKSFDNFRRAFSPDPTDCPWLSEDDSRDDTLYRVPSKSTGHFQIQRIRCRVGSHYGTGLETPPITLVGT